MAGKTKNKVEDSESIRQLHIETMIDNIPGVVYQCKNNQQWTMLFISEQCYELTGYIKKDLILDKTIAFGDLIDKQDRERIWKIIQNAIDKRNSFEIEYRIITRKGKTKWVWEKGRAIRDKKGNVLHIEGFIIDITDKKESENKFIEKERHFQLATKTQSIILASVDRNLKYTWIHNAHPDFNTTDILGKSDIEITGKKGAKELYKLKQRVLKTGKSERREITFELSKENRVYDVIADPIIDPIEGINGVTTASIDVTERVQYRRDLERSNELLHEVGDMAHVGGWEVNLITKEVFWSQNTRKIHEVAPDYQADINEAMTFYPGESRLLIEKAIKEALEKGKNYDLELEFISARGNHRFVRTIGKTEFKNRKCTRFHGTFQDITSLKKAEQKVKKSEKRYHFLFNSLRDAIIVANTDRKIIDCNPAFTELFEYTYDDIIGKETVTLYDIRAEFDEMGKAIRNNQDQLDSFLFVIHYRKKTGEVFFGETNVYYLKDESGKTTGFIGVIRDITDRIKIEKNLSDSESKFRSLFEKMLNGFALHKIITDESEKPVDYVFLEVNNAFEKLTSLKRDTIINKKVTEVMPDIVDDPVDWINKYGEVALKNKDKKFEAYSQSLKKWYHVVAYSLNGGSFATIFEDITDRKQAETVLRKSEERYRGVMENLQLIGLMLDRDGNLIFANDYLLQLTGWERQEILNKNWFDHFIPSDVRQKIKQIFIDTISTGEFPIVYENEIITKSGDIRMIKWNNIFNNKDVKTAHYVTSIGEDITEFKAAEKELLQYRKNLEEIVQKRTSELKEKNEQLERMNNLFVGREFRIKELKEKIKKLEERKST